jgi:hypothetical protein
MNIEQIGPSIGNNDNEGRAKTGKWVDGKLKLDLTESEMEALQHPDRVNPKNDSALFGLIEKEFKKDMFAPLDVKESRIPLYVVRDFEHAIYKNDPELIFKFYQQLINSDSFIFGQENFLMNILIEHYPIAADVIKKKLADGSDSSK